MFSFQSWILGSVRPKRPKYEVHQNEKIRPFFQLARQADSKNVKIFEKNYLLEKFCQENNQEGSQTSQIFCSKKLVRYALNF